MDAAAAGATPAGFSMGCCGSCVRALPGRICRRGTVRPRPATGVSSKGCSRGCGRAFYGRSAKTCWPEENSGWKRASSTPRSSGQKGGDRIGPTRCGKGSKIMAIADCHGLPVAVGVTSASPNESTLVEDTLRQRHVNALPKRRIGDRASDSDRLDERLRREHGIAMIAPNRRRRKRTQDGRPLRCYLRRWKVERLFAEGLSPDQQPLGTSRGQLSRDGSTRLRVDPLEASVRLVLG